MAVSIIYKARHILSQKCLLRLYNPHLLPFINYCNIIQGRASSIRLCLSVLQKRALKIALGMEQCTYSALVYFKSKALPVKDLCDIQCLIFTLKYPNDLLPTIFQGLFAKRVEVMTRSTHSQALLYVNQMRLACIPTSLFHQDSKFWDELLPEIQQSSSLAQFKIKLKELYQQKYKVLT